MSFIASVVFSCLAIILFIICLLSLLFIFGYTYILLVNGVE